MILVQKTMHVAASPATCFRVFTEEMTSWWPLATHHIGAVPAASAVIEPFVGGRWYERGDDGTPCPWGRVLSWEPPARLVLSWEISGEWKADASIQTEVEVRFTEAEGGTTLTLEHRKLEAYGPMAEAMQGVFDSEGGWTGLLGAFVARVAAG